MTAKVKLVPVVNTREDKPNPRDAFPTHVPPSCGVGTAVAACGDQRPCATKSRPTSTRAATARLCASGRS